jgi:AGZA family xanthine/uracil permease-like MFS transporter
MDWVNIPANLLQPDLLSSQKVERTNMAVAKTFVGRHFRLEFSGHKDQRRGSRFLTEVNAGLATFFAMAYIISVNAQIVSRKFGP